MLGLIPPKRCPYALLPGSSGLYISDMTKTECIRNCIGVDAVCTMNASGDSTDCPETLNHLPLCFGNLSLGIDADAAGRVMTGGLAPHSVL